jgi:hypothetical protein
LFDERGSTAFGATAEAGEGVPSRPEVRAFAARALGCETAELHAGARLVPLGLPFNRLFHGANMRARRVAFKSVRPDYASR